MRRSMWWIHAGQVAHGTLYYGEYSIIHAIQYTIALYEYRNGTEEIPTLVVTMAIASGIYMLDYLTSVWLQRAAVHLARRRGQAHARTSTCIFAASQSAPIGRALGALTKPLPPPVSLNSYGVAILACPNACKYK